MYSLFVRLTTFLVRKLTKRVKRKKLSSSQRRRVQKLLDAAGEMRVHFNS